MSIYTEEKDSVYISFRNLSHVPFFHRGAQLIKPATLSQVCTVGQRNDNPTCDLE